MAGNIRCLFLVCVVSVMGCQQQLPTIDVEPIANQLFESLKKNDLDTAISFYSDDFYKNIPPQDWKIRLQTFLEKAGPIQSYRIRNKQADTRYSGKFYIFKIESVHMLNDTENKVQHIMTFIHHVSDKDIKLIAHKITAKGL